MVHLQQLHHDLSDVLGPSSLSSGLYSAQSRSQRHRYVTALHDPGYCTVTAIHIASQYLEHEPDIHRHTLGDRSMFVAASAGVVSHVTSNFCVAEVDMESLIHPSVNFDQQWTFAG